MSSESEDTFDERLESIERRAQNFLELLKDGEEVTIACADGELHVEESYRSKLEREYPKLYGRLMSIEAQMWVGLSSFIFGVVAAGFIIFGLQAGWWDRILGTQASEQLNHVWFFLACPLFAIFLVHIGSKVWIKYVYRRNRPALLALIADAKLDRDVLMVMLRDEKDLDAVIHSLKLDSAP